MKALYTFLIFLLASASVSAQTYYTYTATKSGSWNDMTVWSIGVRMDGVHKTKVVITAPYTVLVDNMVNSFGLGDVEINIMGSLSLQPSTNILLTAGSTVELFGSGSVIGSNNTQQITIGGVVKFDGSLDFTKTGASTASSASGVSPNGFTPAFLLPVVFTSFTAVKNTSEIVLKWSTASEMQNDHFEVERSSNGSAWTQLSIIKGKGTASGGADYTYTDNNANNSMLYYRLKQVDADGAATYSTVKTIRGGNTSAAKIYAAGKTINIELNAPVKNTVVVTVLNTNGQVMEKKQFSAGYKISLEMNNQSNRIMIVHVADNDALNQTVKLFL